MKRLVGLLQRNYALKDLVVKVRPFSAARLHKEEKISPTPRKKSRILPADSH